MLLQTLKLFSTDTHDALIYYTTDGSEPDASKSKFNGYLTIAHTSYKVKAFKNGLEASETLSLNYQISDTVTPSPTISPNGGTFIGSATISITASEGSIFIDK